MAWTKAFATIGVITFVWGIVGGGLKYAEIEWFRGTADLSWFVVLCTLFALLFVAWERVAHVSYAAIHATVIEQDGVLSDNADERGVAETLGRLAHECRSIDCCQTARRIRDEAVPYLREHFAPHEADAFDAEIAQLCDESLWAAKGHRNVVGQVGERITARLGRLAERLIPVAPVGGSDRVR